MLLVTKRAYGRNSANRINNKAQNKKLSLVPNTAACLCINFIIYTHDDKKNIKIK